MTKEERTRKKIVLALKKEIEPNDNHVASSRHLVSILAIIGWAGVTVSIFESLEPHIPLYMISLCGIVGGASLAVATWLNQVKLQWPIIKKLLNHDTIKEAAKEYEL